VTGKKRPQAEILVEQATAASDLFRGSDGHAYALVRRGNRHQETHRIRSSSFRHYLRLLFFLRERKPPSAQALQNAIGVLEALALYAGNEEDVFLRLGERDDVLYLDLANSSWEAVEITADGWTVRHDHRVRFRRTKSMKSLDWPDDNGCLEDLGKFANVGDNDTFILLVSSLLGYLHPKGPYPCLNLIGEQGSAKTTTARVIKALVDPSISPVRTTPRNERDLMIAANNAWILPFDNLSQIPQWLSDALCRLATGGGFSTRQLYSDDEETIFDATRPVIINGIEDLAGRQDLVDRSIFLSLPPIAGPARRTEKSLWQDFRAAQPRILGALLNATSIALRNRHQVDISELPRMADFVSFVTAAEEVLPWAPGEFLHAYRRNRREAMSVALESDQIASTVAELLDRHGGFEGTASDLLNQLNDLVPERIRYGKSWPKSARALSGLLRRSASLLRHDGIEVTFFRQSDRRVILIHRETKSNRHNRHQPPKRESAGDDRDVNDGREQPYSGDLVLFDDDEEEVAV